jgi:predicted RNase H-like HicB family nuclease
VCGTRDKQGRVRVGAWAGILYGMYWLLSQAQIKPKESYMASIEADKGVITQINVFTVAPENQQALIELLIESAESVRDLPGWISANIHRSLDGTRVVNYAQAESMEAQELIVASLRANGFLNRNKLLGEASPGLYEVVYTLVR